MLVRELTKETNQAVKSKIMKQVGKQVIFDYGPNEGRLLEGKLVDRVVMHANPEELDRAPYWDVVDKIQFGEELWLRFGYYRMPENRLQWCAQTTLTEPLRTWKELLINTASEKPWFRELLEEVILEAKGADACRHALHDNHVMIS